MRNSRLLASLAATAILLIGAFAPQALAGPAPGGPAAPPSAQPALAPPKPYKVVPIQLPKPFADASFEAFRRQLSGIAQRKDRAALARIVAQGFFWIPEDQDAADKTKSGIDNLSEAIGLGGRDGQGWEVLGQFAADPTGDPNTQRQGVVCAPGEAVFDEKEADEAATATGTEPAEWVYPAVPNLQVRSGLQPNSAVIERLGMHLIRVYPDDSPAAAVQGTEATRIVTPSGKVGYVQTEQLRGLAQDQLCYIKEGNTWKIIGVIGGGN